MKKNYSYNMSAGVWMLSGLAFTFGIIYMILCNGESGFSGFMHNWITVFPVIVFIIMSILLNVFRKDPHIPLIPVFALNILFYGFNTYTCFFFYSYLGGNVFSGDIDEFFSALLSSSYVYLGRAMTFLYLTVFTVFLLINAIVWKKRAVFTVFGVLSLLNWATMWVYELIRTAVYPGRWYGYAYGYYIFYYASAILFVIAWMVYTRKIKQVEAEGITPPEPDYYTCPACGNQIPKGDNFCEICGEPVVYRGNTMDEYIVR